MALAYRAGTSCTCVFASEDGGSSGVVHGDDFVFEGALSSSTQWGPIGEGA